MDKLIPLVTLNDINQADKVLSALKANGYNSAEITFRTDCAAEAIAYAREKYPEMQVGAGTVINAEMCTAAIRAGAKFIISPGLSDSVAKMCKENDIPYYPGCVTPTEIMHALELGITTVKFFPAGIYGGVKALKALSGPFPQVKFIPTGGVNRENLADYLAFDKVVAVGGSFITEEALKND